MALNVIEVESNCTVIGISSEIETQVWIGSSYMASRENPAVIEFIRGATFARHKLRTAEGVYKINLSI